MERYEKIVSDVLDRDDSYDVSYITASTDLTKRQVITGLSALARKNRLVIEQGPTYRLPRVQDTPEEI